MSIYEYRAGEKGCELCRRKFEVRQGINDPPLEKCPRCGARVERLISRPFICVLEPLPLKETFKTHTEEEADGLGLDLTSGFAEDQVWETPGFSRPEEKPQDAEGKAR